MIIPSKVCSGCGLPKIFDSFYKNKSRYDGLNNYCKLCDSKRIGNLRAKNPSAFKEVNKKSYVKRKVLILAKQKEYRELNTEKIKVKNSTYYINNKDRISTNNRVWKQNNPDKVADMDARRRAAELKATPPWTTPEMKIDTLFFYTIRAGMARPANWQVDHIHPLQGKYVRGLHIPSNLRLIQTLGNQKKNNKFTPTVTNYVNGVAV